MKKATYVVLAVLCFTAICWSQNIGDSYCLHRPGKTIPAHPGPGDRSISVRFAHGDIAIIQNIDQATGWYEVEVNGVTGWIVKKYFGEPCGVTAPAPGILAYSIGTWNLEWLKDGRTRGFPEYNNGGPTIPPRTDNDYVAIAEVIANELESAVLVLTEIGGRRVQGVIESQEMDRLLSYLPNTYNYIITESGGQQHVVILYDVNKVRLNTSFELEVPREAVQNSDIFYRDPLIAHFTFLNQGNDQSLNDFVIVGLHLASGQSKNQNHDRAMEVLRDNLENFITEGEILPENEQDIIMAGDLNLNFFDNHTEHVLEAMETGPYDVLADNPYTETRLGGVPLALLSRIDYIIATDAMQGRRLMSLRLQSIRTWQTMIMTDLGGFSATIFP